MTSNSWVSPQESISFCILGTITLLICCCFIKAAQPILEMSKRLNIFQIGLINVVLLLLLFNSFIVCFNLFKIFCDFLRLFSHHLLSSFLLLFSADSLSVITHYAPYSNSSERFFFHLVTFLFPAFLCFIFPSLHSCILPSPWKQKYPRYAIDLNNIFLTSRENFYYMSLHNVWWSRFSIDFYLVVNSMNSLTIKWICSPLQSPRFRNLFPRLFATQG